MCDKLQHRATRLSKNLIVTVYWEFACHRRATKRNLLRNFLIKRVQFFIAIKRLIIDKDDYYSADSFRVVRVHYLSIPPRRRRVS